ncbi:MAG: hypothetical protein IT371_02330 [Deltaproteobacteria bacterium]|nr:hypothetical protein [Deltaproteobacteria bacterium]
MAPLLAQANAAPGNDKALKIIARSLFKELKQNGYDSRQIVSLSTELISLVTSDLRGEQSNVNPQ